MRVIIVGVGGVGAMAAWRLAKAGHDVVALEQFRIDHDLGSSFGDSRIVRRVYPDALYTELMADAYPLWDELCAASPEEELFARVGGIFFGPADHPDVRAAEAALASSGTAYETLDCRESARRFPAVALRPEEIAVYEPSMGYARASRCVRAAVQSARSLGATIIEDSPAVHIESVAGQIRVTTRSGEIVVGDRLLLSVGPWARPLLAELGVTLPLVVTRQPYVHLLPARNAADFEIGRFPVWIDAEANAYGFPRLGDVPGVKIGMHDRGAVTTPETADREVRELDIAAVREYAARRFPSLGPAAAYSKVCLYTNTPNEDFLIDAVPGLPGVYLIGGLSGHGFKFTPLLGQLAADLLTDTAVPYDLSRFRIRPAAAAR